LGHLLQEHPLLLKSKGFEAHFFDYNEALNKAHRHRAKRRRKRKLKLTEPVLCDLRRRYANYFELKKVHANPQLLSYEKSPSYIMQEHVPERIRTVTPWAKLIVTLRNPVDR
jgi:hypothetical protein